MASTKTFEDAVQKVLLESGVGRLTWFQQLPVKTQEEVRKLTRNFLAGEYKISQICFCLALIGYLGLPVKVRAVGDWLRRERFALLEEPGNVVRKARPGVAGGGRADPGSPAGRAKRRKTKHSP